MTDENKQQIGMDGQALVAEYQLYRRLGSFLILGAFLILIVGLSLAALLQPALPSTTIGKMGVHLLLDDGRNNWDTALWSEHMAYAAQISNENGIAVQVIRSDDLAPERWQVFMDLTAEHSLTPVLRLSTTFDFENNWWTAPQRDADGSYTSWGENYAEFINALEWSTAQKHVILLNEVNNGHEWGGNPNPEDYANFVRDVAAVLRAEVENIVILNAAFDLNLPNTNGEFFPNSTVILIDANSFIDRMEAAQPNIFATFDIWNSHPYPLDIRSHPNVQIYRFDTMNGAAETAITPPDGIFNRGINGYQWELWKLAQLGYATDIPVMITETGWRHSAAIDPNSADAAPDYPSPVQIAEFFQLALLGGDDVTFRPWLDDERVIAIAPFALNGVPNEWNHTNLIQVDADGTVLGTYAHFEALAAIANPD